MNIISETSIKLVTSIPGPKSQAWLARSRAALPRGISNVLPVFAKHAEGAVIEDIDGNHFLDFAGGIGCQNMGYGNENVVKAIQEQAAEFTHTCFMVVPYSNYVLLAERLNDAAPGPDPKKTILFTSGAEAVENAVKIARSYTGRQGIIAFSDGFHGRTLLALSLTSKTHPYKSGFGPFAPEIYRMPYAYCYRCSYNLTYPSCNVECARRLEDTFKRQIASESVAAVIFEPVLGEGGFVIPPPEWFAEIATICKRHGVLVIADEVQTGFGRTGPIFASKRFGLEPDLIVTAKSLTGGLPMGAVTGRSVIMDAPDPGGLGGTFGGNPIACAAALATWDTYEQLDLGARAEKFGALVRQLTQDWKERFPIIGDIRGVGAMCAFELVRSQATREPAGLETKKIITACHQAGLLLLSAGTHNNVIRLLAPLVVTENQMREGFRIIEEALSSFSNGTL